MAPVVTATRVAILVLALLAAWRALEVNLAWYDDSGRPRVPAPDAASELAPSERVARERTALARMLAANPADTAALLMLAREHDRAGEAPRADRAYRAALDVAPMDRHVLAHAALHYLRRGEAIGIGILARLAANYPDTQAWVFPILAQTMVTPAYREAWEAVVARAPAWLGRFVLDACQRGVEPAALVPTVVARAAAGRSHRAEGNCVVDALRARDRWEEAYHLWLSLLPRERLANVGWVHNGSFELPLIGGFDWITQEASEREAGHVADIVPVPAATGRVALRVIYVGKRQNGPPVRQVLALPPGRYELSGLARQEAVTAVRGIHWTVRCLQGGKPGEIVAASERFIGSSEWRRFVVEVAVGDQCRGQLLQLEPVAEPGSVAFVSGTAWFDDFRIERK